MSKTSVRGRGSGDEAPPVPFVSPVLSSSDSPPPDVPSRDSLPPMGDGAASPTDGPNGRAVTLSVGTEDESTGEVTAGQKAVSPSETQVVDEVTDRSYRRAHVTTAPLSKDLVEKEGGVINRESNPRLGLFIAARAEALQRRADRTESDALRYDDGAVAKRREGEHIKSIQSYAEDVWRRLYKRAIPQGDPLDDEEFHRLYRRVQKVIKRSGLIENRGDAVTAGHRKHRHAHGRRMALPERVRSATEGQPVTVPPEAVPCAAPRSFPHPGLDLQSDSGKDARDVALKIERHVAEKDSLHREFTHARTAGRINGPRHTANGRRFERRHAREADGRPHYLSVGRWRREEIDRKEVTKAVRIPWVIAEIDGRKRGQKSREVSDRLARRLVRRLKDQGVDLSKVVVSYSGNASIHVRIPDGAVGCPIYRSGDAASTALRRFFDRLCGEEELRRGVDNTVLRPSQFIRATGSIHEKTGRRTVGTTGEIFLEKPPYFLWRLSEPDFQYTQPESFPLPRKSDFNPKLADLLYKKPSASPVSSQSSVSQSVSRSTGGATRVAQGVSEGEPWGLDVPGAAHMEGRNWAALIRAHFLLNGDPPKQTAWEDLRRWNRKNDPPLPKKELRRVFEHAVQYRTRNSRVWKPTKNTRKKSRGLSLEKRL